mmetsp:Transcript_43223/g.41573  ORF Transcript_43223/g.41573 Transcript_43223/m.41573 type:complete len:124 (+) Transcript_43223:713-1084(+)
MWMKLPHPRYLLRLVPPSLIEISNFLQRKVVRPWLLMELVPLVNDLLWIALHLVFLSIRVLEELLLRKRKTTHLVRERHLEQPFHHVFKVITLLRRLSHPFFPVSFQYFVGVYGSFMESLLAF